MINFEIFDPHLEAILVLDESEKVIYCNEVFATLVELSRRKIVKKISFAELISFEQSADGFHLSKVTESTPYKEALVKTASGKEVRIQYTMQRLGTDPHWLVYFKDVTLEERLQGKYRAELEQKEGVITELENAKLKLEDYSKNLEKMVEDRTFEVLQLNKQMKALLDSLSQGFLMFDSEGSCLQVYSKACETLFNNPIADQKIWNVLGFEEKKADSLRKWLMTVFSEMLPFEDLAPLGPQRIEAEGKKTISLEYFPLRNENKIEAVVVVATDITSLLAAQIEAKTERERAHFVLNLVQKKKQFSSFMEETERIILHCDQSIQHPDWNEDVRTDMLRYLHTIKGSAALYSLAGVPEICHEAEEQVKMLKLPLGEFSLQPLVHQLNFLKNKITEIKNQASSILGQKLFSKEKWFEISSEQVHQWIQILESSTPEKESLLQQELNKLWLEPARLYFTPYSEVIESLAARLGKKMAPLEIHDDGCHVPPAELNEIFGSFVHVFRNSMDHGIETPSERIAAGKSEDGKIKVHIKLHSKENHKELEIQVRDDGKGISAERLRLRLIEKNPDQQDKFIKMSETDLIQHIFDDDITTHDQVTDISGRGVGLSALKYAIEAKGGSIRVTTEAGKGTLITAKIPMKLHFWKQTQLQAA